MTDLKNDKDTVSAEESHAGEGNGHGLEEQVHSANAWEKADLGDADRKNKFLRLMGAGKKSHQGRFVIGDHNPEHMRDKEHANKLEHELEDQYDQSMQHRLAGGRGGHVGLGYHDADVHVKHKEDSDAKDKEEKDNEEEASAEQEEDGQSEEEDEKEKQNRKRESTGEGQQEEAPEEKKRKLEESSS